MKSSNSIGTRRVLCVTILSAIALGMFSPMRSVLAQGGTLEAIVGVPKYVVGPLPSPPFVYVVFVQGVKITATLPTLLNKQANETPAQASQRKAAAVVAALNTDIKAKIVAGLLGANTPLATVGTSPATVPNVDKSGVQIPGQAATKPNVAVGYGVVVLDGVTGLGGPKDGGRDPSGEPGGTPIIRPGAGSTGGVKASMGGTGAGTGLATGVDPLGARSFVSFGAFESRALDANCASVFDAIAMCPGAYIATVNPIAGQNDAQVFGALAGVFNSLFSVLGFTASYDPLADLLSIDQPINNYLSLFTQSTDAGLQLTGALQVVPEPASSVLVAIGVVGLAVMHRRRRRRSALHAQPQ